MNNERFFARRELIRTSVGLGAALSVPGMSQAALRQSRTGSEYVQTEYVPVDTTNGRLRGARIGDVCRFLGVAYGGQVSGAARFKAPPPPPQWPGVKDALEFGAASLQVTSGGAARLASARTPAFSEDCLFLNIWTPAVDGARRPVMFYNHGGGVTTGSANQLAQDGSHLAARNDVVVVQSSHRLGISGYLYLGELLGPEYAANQGLLDIVAALRWTHDNIASFGGDPNNIMLFGESGGGQKTACIYAIPSANTFFSKASIESTSAVTISTREQAQLTARAALTKLGLAPGDARKLLDLSSVQLLDLQESLSVGGGPAVVGGPPAPIDVPRLWPFVDGQVLPQHPFSPSAPACSAGKPLIIGATSDEAVWFNIGDPSMFSLDEAGLDRRLGRMMGANTSKVLAAYKNFRPGATPSQLMIAIEGAAMIWAGDWVMAERKVTQKAAPVYMYRLTYPSPTLVPGTAYPIGSPHTSDISLKFDNPGSIPGDVLTTDQSSGRYAAATNMSRMWAAFAHTGQPSAPGLPVWPAYDLASRATMFIDSHCHVVMDPNREERLFWAGLGEP